MTGANLKYRWCCDVRQRPHEEEEVEVEANVHCVKLLSMLFFPLSTVWLFYKGNHVNHRNNNDDKDDDGHGSNLTSHQPTVFDATLTQIVLVPEPDQTMSATKS